MDKKKYIKPEVTVESFALNENIASGCVKVSPSGLWLNTDEICPEDPFDDNENDAITEERMLFENSQSCDCYDTTDGTGTFSS